MTSHLSIEVSSLQAELLLREDNYNNTFANGGAGKNVLNVGKAQHAQDATMAWMFGKKKNSTTTNGRSGSGRVP